MSMGIGTAEKTAERVLRGGHALLDAWLAALNQVDNPMRRRLRNFGANNGLVEISLQTASDPAKSGFHCTSINSSGLFDQEARAKCPAPSAFSFRFA